MSEHKPNHDSVANVIFDMIGDGAVEKDIADYLRLVYGYEVVKSLDRWVDRQGGSFTPEEIDDKGWH